MKRDPLYTRQTLNDTTIMNAKAAKKIRKEVKAMQGSLASDLKTWLNEQPIKRRIGIAMRIIFRRKW